MGRGARSLEGLVVQQAEGGDTEKGRATPMTSGTFAEPQIEDMVREVNGSSPLYRPSKYWEWVNRANLDMLSEHGLSSFKRTVSQNYFNWLVVNPRDNQFRSVLRDWLAHPTLQPLLNRVDTPRLILTMTGVETSVKPWHLFIYKLFVGFLWELIHRTDRTGLAEKLEEPLVGGPIAIVRRGKRISQDLANSIREYNTVLEVDPRLQGTHKRVAELGAGYGRLAYLLLQDNDTRYFIFDIPPALYVSQWYLGRVFGEKAIFRFRHIGDFSRCRDEIERSRVAFFTPNQIELFPDRFFDLFATISTLPEMTLEQAKNYLAQMRRTTSRYIYLKQWKDWENQNDAQRFSKVDFDLGEDFQCVLDRTDAVHHLFFEQVWRRRAA
jgi:putative sugar O-methyltransferase